MSSRADMKALFRQKQQERAKTSGAVAKPLSGKEQALLLKAKRKAERPAATTPAPPKPAPARAVPKSEQATFSMPPPPPRAKVETTAPVETDSPMPSALPADFFDTSSANKKQKINEDKVEARAVKATPPEAPAPQPSRPPKKSAPQGPPGVPPGFFDSAPGPQGQKEEVAAESSNESKLPKGFFDDKEKDNAARGVVVEKKKPEDAYKEFQQAIEVDMKEMEELEEHEAEAAATERAERVEFEQKQQMSVVAEFRAESQKRIQELREKRNVARDIAKRQAKGRVSSSVPTPTLAACSTSEGGSDTTKPPRSNNLHVLLCPGPSKE
ncbi:hypothetical protein CYMTET_23930 [Cymbomonas tetramitiformis]|uniref:Uncharacterized protein n=1 Tax=Cymbomonas tetramitiformis TaxID=36881 RepID=A0AAE0FX40_9CHLO|nr:hypothetical protein CYMTET_23930 [Cymbomonas tetramitiformis]